MDKEYICPKCGSTDKRPEPDIYSRNINMGVCGNCGYTGVFLIKEKVKITKKKK